MAQSPMKLESDIHHKYIEKPNISFVSGFGYVNFSKSDYLPSGATFVGGVVRSLPNEWYIQGNIGDDTNNIVFNYQNTHTAAIPGTCKLCIFYTLGGGN